MGDSSDDDDDHEEGPVNPKEWVRKGVQSCHALMSPYAPRAAFTDVRLCSIDTSQLHWWF
jgi:hypothetical protein